VRLFGLLVVAVAAVVGCSGKGVQRISVINGKVTYQGKPLPAGIVRFVSAEKTSAIGTIRRDGTFAITDVAPGEFKVSVMERPQSSGSSSGEPAPAQPPPVDLPGKYRDPETSGLTYTITPETKDIHIDIK
jgi:hypothetical protein